MDVAWALLGFLVLVFLVRAVWHWLHSPPAPVHRPTERRFPITQQDRFREELPPLNLSDVSPASGLSFSASVQMQAGTARSNERFHALRAAPVDVPVLGSYEIDYADADGIVTRRIIDVHEVEARGVAIYLSAYCRLRGGERTFRADRILRAVDCDTGQVIAPVEEHFFDMIPPDERPDPEFEAMMGRVGPSLSVLVWIARANNDIGVEEVEVLLDYIEQRRKLAGDGAGSDGWNHARALAEIMEMRPTMTSSIGIIGKMSRRGREYPLVRDYAARIAAMGGRLEEQRRKRLFG